MREFVGSMNHKSGAVGAGLDIQSDLNLLRVEELEQSNRVLERALQKREQELQFLQHEFDSLIYAFSHDLRAPLRGLDGLILALTEDCDDSLTELAKDYLQQIVGNGRHLIRLIDGLLELSRAARSPMRRQKVDLTKIASSIAAELKQRQPDRVVEIIIQSDLAEEGDEPLLKVAMGKLLENAWKFSSLQEKSRIELSCIIRDQERTYLLRDNGAGFNMDYSDKLFAPFQRFHAVDEFPGVGIGLAIAQRIINRHGGRIWAESKPDHGATFYFTLSP